MTDQRDKSRWRDKARARADAEIRLESEGLRDRADYFPELGYFLEILADGGDPGPTARRAGRPTAAVLCLQAPLELIHAHGFQPFKIFGGVSAAAGLAAPSLPAIMCPMLRSAVGKAMLGETAGPGTTALWVLPTTCDWSVKLPAMLERCGLEIPVPSHRLELPRLKDRAESQERWLEEVYGLRNFLRGISGLKRLRPALKNSMELYQRAWRALVGLAELKRAGRVAEAWALVIANSFFFDRVETWTARLEGVLPRLRENRPRGGGRPVFLAGSPVFFPNLKIPRLLEEAGLDVVMDDLCSSERLFPGAARYDDDSEHGLLRALAQRYHQGCLCPTFADNDRRVNNIVSPAHRALFRGVVHQVLKGCHPFDLEGLLLEGRVKAEGLKFIRLETDYGAEDGQNILTRLEAFRGTLG
ncbi:MAG: 2-hydroxyacyl-CoA dehydratase family protein [Deltaproteobacteria bacterium]|jgi:benzoyl-CoA reductase/2-hydroxyglutaryl-CoA dehydratase subunit BcrC/BadD/HgdB|nr:2-hydroxyacyl-CoA dehydratase family protein [Deltaproteobacteria bacterium]